MKHSSAIMLAFLVLPTQGPAVPFDIDSTGSTYPFAGHVTGRFAESGDSLIIDVSGGSVVSHIPASLGDQGRAVDVSLAFGLGRADGDAWALGQRTEKQVVSDVLSPEGSAKFGAMRFVIHRVDTLPLQDRWLVGQISVRQHLPGIKEGWLASYACAEDNLHGPTAESRQRATKMRDRYSTIC